MRYVFKNYLVLESEGRTRERRPESENLVGGMFLTFNQGHCLTDGSGYLPNKLSYQSSLEAHEQMTSEAQEDTTLLMSQLSPELFQDIKA